jgi:hypothetical protein
MIKTYIPALQAFKAYLVSSSVSALHTKPGPGSVAIIVVPQNVSSPYWHGGVSFI